MRRAVVLVAANAIDTVVGAAGIVMPVLSDGSSCMYECCTLNGLMIATGFRFLSL